MKKMVWILFPVLLITLWWESGCKKSEEAAKQYVLTVQNSAGVKGDPQSGTFNHQENSSVPYSYSADTGYKSLQVTLDGQPASASGTITMNMSHALASTAQRILYLQGNWNVTFLWTTQTCTLQDSMNQACTGTQNGDDLELFIISMNATAKGKIDLAGNFELTVDIPMQGNILFKYKLKGKMSGENSFSGEVTAEGYLNNVLNCTATGSFTGNKA